MKLKYLYILLFIGLLADAVFSFCQFYQTSLGGDVAESVLPTPIMEPLFRDPLGIGLFTNPTPYHNPNRYFSHYSYYQVFNKLPAFFRNFFSPITSIYLSAAVFKLCIQLLLIFLTSIYTSRDFGKGIKFLLLTAVILTPFFQSFGYRSYIGIIDLSITYVFFYAFPLALLIIYYLPIFIDLKVPRNRIIRIGSLILWILLALVVCLSGPLNPGIVLIISLLLFVKYIFLSDEKRSFLLRFSVIPSRVYWLIIPISVFALYSLYIGSFNAYTVLSRVPVTELYSKMPSGLISLITQKLAWPLILVFLGFNYLLLRGIRSPKAIKVKSEFYWIIAFCVLYILLLPLGGYRSYRPLVLRYDTILPLTMACLYLIARSSLFLQNVLEHSKKYSHLILLITLLVIFINADLKLPAHNACEKEALITLAEARESPVEFDGSCNIMGWEPVTEPAESAFNAKVFNKWGITDSLVLYFQK